jgi:hypothetical protein
MTVQMNSFKSVDRAVLPIVAAMIIRHDHGLTGGSQGVARPPEPHGREGEALLAHGVSVCCSRSCCSSRSAGVQ